MDFQLENNNHDEICSVFVLLLHLLMLYQNCNHLSKFLLQAKPYLHKGMGAVEELLDPSLKCTRKNLAQIARMIQAAAACISNEESRRPGIEEIIAILRGEEAPIYCNRKKSNFSGIIDCYPQLQQTKSEMRSHLALAMLGVPDFEDDDHLYCR